MSCFFVAYKFALFEEVVCIPSNKFMHFLKEVDRLRIMQDISQAFDLVNVRRYLTICLHGKWLSRYINSVLSDIWP